MSFDFYRPGDVILKDGPKRTLVFVVADPPYSVHGKLQLRRETGTILSTWWGSGRDPAWLPPHYRRVRS